MRVTVRRPRGAIVPLLAERIPVATRSSARPSWRYAMMIDVLVLQPLVALIFGILILIMPRLLNFLVAIYLIVVGITGLWPHVLH
jgi:hypothetical protein